MSEEGVQIMGAITMFMHRYVVPFMAGVCMAMASASTDLPVTIVLAIAGSIFAIASLPKDRLIFRPVIQKAG